MWRAGCVVAFVLLAAGLTRAASERLVIEADVRDRTAQELIDKHGAGQAERIKRGARQVAERWWASDGDADAYSSFCLENFYVDPGALDETSARLETALEQVTGHLHEIRRELTRPLELETGPISNVDRMLAEVDLAAHLDENLYRTKAAFVALLNFPVHTLAERLARAESWSREDWARSRMMDRFTLRLPASVERDITSAFSKADQYVAEYNIRMDRLLVPGAGGAPTPAGFAEGLRLITHWGLRDELKSQYAEADGLARQRLILKVMERIVRQEIPQQVIDSPDYDWNPLSNEVWRHGAEGGAAIAAAREPDTRYEHLRAVFRAVHQADPYSPTAPTFIDRRFDEDREIPEAEVRALLVSVLDSPEFRGVAETVRARLGRKLEPFDIWYDGFKSRGSYGEQELDRIVSERYPKVEAFQKGLPEILRALGFSPERATWLAERIVVDPARGAGHALGAVRREDQAHLRTRFGPNGMDYKGYNIAIHELGHNVEQVFSLNGIEHWWLNGVPNTAFTEALAFVFQARDLELLGLAAPGEDARHLEALDTLWATAEIGGVALVDMGVWRWMYEHPEASAAELREATLTIARDVWNRHYAPTFGVRDSEILAIYSHMIVYGLYLPDYPLGHIIAFQVAEKLRQGDFGAEFERVARQGRLTPDAWMRGAVGRPLSSAALLSETRAALAALASASR